MEIEFLHRKEQKTYESSKDLARKYGPKQAIKIIQRINELQAAESLADIKNLPQARLHPLHSNLEGCFAVDLMHPYRMVLFPLGDFNPTDLTSIKKIQIRQIYDDYH
jgi:proteic killer suppression protein